LGNPDLDYYVRLQFLNKTIDFIRRIEEQTFEKFNKEIQEKLEIIENQIFADVFDIDRALVLVEEISTKYPQYIVKKNPFFHQLLLLLKKEHVLTEDTLIHICKEIIDSDDTQLLQQLDDFLSKIDKKSEKKKKINVLNIRKWLTRLLIYALNENKISAAKYVYQKLSEKKIPKELLLNELKEIKNKYENNLSEASLEVLDNEIFILEQQLNNKPIQYEGLRLGKEIQKQEVASLKKEALIRYLNNQAVHFKKYIQTQDLNLMMKLFKPDTELIWRELLYDFLIGKHSKKLDPVFLYNKDLLIKIIFIVLASELSFMDRMNILEYVIYYFIEKRKKEYVQKRQAFQKELNQIQEKLDAGQIDNAFFKKIIEKIVKEYTWLDKSYNPFFEQFLILLQENRILRIFIRNLLMIIIEKDNQQLLAHFNNFLEAFERTTNISINLLKINQMQFLQEALKQNSLKAARYIYNQMNLKLIIEKQLLWNSLVEFRSSFGSKLSENTRLYLDKIINELDNEINQALQPKKS